MYLQAVVEFHGYGFAYHVFSLKRREKVWRKRAQERRDDASNGCAGLQVFVMYISIY